MSRGLKSLAAVAVVVLLVVLGARLLGGGEDDGSDEGVSAQEATGSPTESATVPAAPDGTPAEGMYVLSEVTAEGQVEVRTWLRSPQPLDELDLTTVDPDLAPGSVESLDLVVRSMSNKVLARRDSVGTNLQTVALRTPATELYLTYTIDGALDTASETVQDRQLVRVLGMDVAYEGAGGDVRRVIEAPGTVLNVACLTPSDDFDASPRPCGASSGSGDWTVDLTGAETNDRLLASIEGGAG